MVFTETSRLVDHGTLSGTPQIVLSLRRWKWLFIPAILLLATSILLVAIIETKDAADPEMPEIPIDIPVLQSSSSSLRNVNTSQKNSNSRKQIIFTDSDGSPVSEFNLVITSENLAPDNYLQETYLINGQFPGPTLRVKYNSTIIVNISNQLKNNSITIHFHGIHQRGNFLNDGVPGVTQIPIHPGTNFTYTINTWPQTGTFFYHAHTGMDIVSLFGAIIIEDPPAIYKTFPAEYQYDAEKVFTLNGVYHSDLGEIMKNILAEVHLYPRIINSIIINGKSYGIWNDTMNSTTQMARRRTSGYEVITVQPGQRYRFRFINAASDSMLFCNITGHKFTVIEMDGIYTKPVTTDTLLISPGQRYSIIIHMDQTPANYDMICRHTDTLGPLNGLAIINYKGVPYPTIDEREKDMGQDMVTLPLSKWILDDLSPNYDLDQTDVYALPAVVDKEIMVDVDEVVDGERFYYTINGHHFEEQEIPYFQQLKMNMSIKSEQVFEILKGQVIQIIFQNRRSARKSCFSHPWHLHGHTYYVIGEGPDTYDPVVDGQKLKENTKVESGNTFRFRDTFNLFANQTVVDYTIGVGCGWTAIRFIANNPGVWLAHCHITPHMIMGKKFVFWEHSDVDPFLSEIM